MQRTNYLNDSYSEKTFSKKTSLRASSGTTASPILDRSRNLPQLSIEEANLKRRPSQEEIDNAIYNL